MEIRVSPKVFEKIRDRVMEERPDSIIMYDMWIDSDTKALYLQIINKYSRIKTYFVGGDQVGEVAILGGRKIQ